MANLESDTDSGQLADTFVIGGHLGVDYRSRNRQFLGRFVVIRDDHIDALGGSRFHRLMAGYAAIHGHQQGMVLRTGFFN